MALGLGGGDDGMLTSSGNANQGAQQRLQVEGEVDGLRRLECLGHGYSPRCAETTQWQGAVCLQRIAEKPAIRSIWSKSPISG